MNINIYLTQLYSNFWIILGDGDGDLSESVSELNSNSESILQYWMVIVLSNFVVFQKINLTFFTQNLQTKKNNILQHNSKLKTQ